MREKKNGFLIIVLLHVGVKEEEVQSFTPGLILWLVQTLISSILLVYIFSDRKENEVVSRMMDKVSTWRWSPIIVRQDSGDNNSKTC